MSVDKAIHLSMERGVPIRIKHLLHSSAVRYGDIFNFTLTRAIT